MSEWSASEGPVRRRPGEIYLRFRNGIFVYIIDAGHLRRIEAGAPPGSLPQLDTSIEMTPSDCVKNTIQVLRLFLKEMEKDLDDMEERMGPLEVEEVVES
jgi:hypothetical protein